MDYSSSIFDRVKQLQKEQEAINRMERDQIGTSIPRLFSQADSFVVNPSSVGTGILARMMETDDAVSSSIQFKILMIMSKIGEYHHDNSEINDFVNGFLKKLKHPTWPEALEAMLSCKGYGFSVSEFNLGLDSNLNKVPVSISTYHPSTIAFETDQFGKITENGVIQFILQTSQFTNPNGRFFGVQYGWNIKNPFQTPTDRLLPWRIPFLSQYGMTRIPRNKVIHLTNLPMFSFGSPYGKTEVRTAHLAWQLKNFLLKQVGVAGKRNANGFLWGTAPHNGQNIKVKTPNGEMDVNAAEALRNLLSEREGDDAVVTGPEANGWKLTSMSINGNMDSMMNTIDKLDTKIFRAFLLPSLVMTDGSAGSRALGDKHFEIVNKIAESESIKFCQSIINDMIERIVKENFGEQEDYGSFKQRPQGIEERERLANMFATLTTSGVLKNHVKEDMAYMRQTLSLPKDADNSFDIEDRKDESEIE